MSFKDKINEALEEAIRASLEEKKKMDPVGKADADIDNDGDVDDSDEYLHNRRKAIKKAMAKEDLDDFDDFIDSLDEEQLDEISAKLARKAAAVSQQKAFDMSNYASDKDSNKEADRLQNKADKAMAHVQKRQGDKGAEKTGRLANKAIFGRSRG
jgi:ribose 1,5-bisphosphokinase PhnN